MEVATGAFLRGAWRRRARLRRGRVFRIGALAAREIPADVIDASRLRGHVHLQRAVALGGELQHVVSGLDGKTVPHAIPVPRVADVLAVETHRRPLGDDVGLHPRLSGDVFAATLLDIPGAVGPVGGVGAVGGVAPPSPSRDTRPRRDTPSRNTDSHRSRGSRRRDTRTPHAHAHAHARRSRHGPRWRAPARDAADGRRRASSSGSGPRRARGGRQGGTEHDQERRTEEGWASDPHDRPLGLSVRPKRRIARAIPAPGVVAACSRPADASSRAHRRPRAGTLYFACLHPSPLSAAVSGSICSSSWPPPGR
jgi:hypothetical protein